MMGQCSTLIDVKPVTTCGRLLHRFTMGCLPWPDPARQFKRAGSARLAVRYPAMNGAVAEAPTALLLGPVERIAISDTEEYIRSAVSGQIRRIHRKVTDILSRVVPIADLPSLANAVYIGSELKLGRPLPEWLSAALRYDPRYQQIKAELEDLHTAGFFLAVAPQGLQALAGSAVSKRISCIAIPTRSRPGRLADLIKEVIADLERRERSTEVEILIVDDAREEDIQRANISAICMAVRQAGGISVRYAGLGEKIQFAEHLSGELGSDRDVLAEALLGPANAWWTLGANRNGILLDTIGKCTLMVDDDFNWSLSSSPTAGRNVILGPENAPLDTYVFNTADEAHQFSLQHQAQIGILDVP